MFLDVALVFWELFFQLFCRSLSIVPLSGAHTHTYAHTPAASGSSLAFVFFVGLDLTIHSCCGHGFFCLPSFSLAQIFQCQNFNDSRIIMKSSDSPSTVLFALQNCNIRLRTCWRSAWRVSQGSVSNTFIVMLPHGVTVRERTLNRRKGVFPT